MLLAPAIELLVQTVPMRKRQLESMREPWLSPFQLFVVAGLIGTIAIGSASVFASNRAGEAEAISQVRARTLVVASTVVEPNLSAALFAGDPQAIAQLDEVVKTRVLDDSTLRVKLWDADGRIVYSDVPALIGETYALSSDKQDSLRAGGVVSEISNVDGPENRFEAEIADEMLEVYLPLRAPDGSALLYESYFDTSAVTDSTSRIRTEFVPIILAALLLLEALHLGLAWTLSRRLETNRAERERLLQRAIESSNLERRRIAADLHDGVVQDLVGTSFAVNAAVESATVHAPELAGDLRVAAAGTRHSLQSLRSLLVDIYPPNLHQRGLEAALDDLLAPAANLGIDAKLSMTGTAETSPSATSLVYRVVQESVRNVFRHANATELLVEVDAAEAALTATISDNGNGFFVGDDRGGSHLGLRLLHDLTSDSGAEFVVGSKPGVGTDVRVEVPQ